jgi:hypothetical protein
MHESIHGSVSSDAIDLGKAMADNTVLDEVLPEIKRRRSP